MINCFKLQNNMQNIYLLTKKTKILRPTRLILKNGFYAKKKIDYLITNN